MGRSLPLRGACRRVDAGRANRIEGLPGLGGLRLSESARTELIAALSRVLTAFAHLALRQRVGFAECRSLLQTAFVAAAVAQIAETQEPVTASRVAARTGIARSIVTAALGGVGLPSVAPRRTWGQRVLTGWYEDPRFRTRGGDPAVLPLQGESTSFEALVRAHSSGGFRPAVVLNELLEAGAVKVLEGERVKPLRRNVGPGGADPETLRQMGEAVSALLHAFDQNLVGGPDEQLPVRGVTRQAPQAVVPVFRAQMRRRTDSFIETSEAYVDGNLAMAQAGAKAASPDDLVTLITYAFVTALPQPKAPRFHGVTRLGQALATSRREPKPSKPRAKRAAKVSRKRR